jgi:hypothetical protein
MSMILDRLKEAEARRQEVIAERKRLEAEADAALAAREREERGMPPPAKGEERAAQPVRPDRRPWAGGAVVIALVLVAGFWSGMFSAEKEPIKEPAKALIAVPAAPKTEPEPGNPPFQLKLDRDADAFAARVKDREKE